MLLSFGPLQTSGALNCCTEMNVFRTALLASLPSTEQPAKHTCIGVDVACRDPSVIQHKGDRAVGPDKCPTCNAILHCRLPIGGAKPADGISTLRPSESVIQGPFHTRAQQLQPIHHAESEGLNVNLSQICCHVTGPAKTSTFT